MENSVEKSENGRPIARTERYFGDRRTLIFQSGEGGPILIQPVGQNDDQSSEREVRLIDSLTDGKPFTLAVFMIKDWFSELPPWNFDLPFLKKPYQGGAPETLRFLLDQLLPELEKSWPGSPLYLGGYSLGGLFSLWAAHECDRFVGINAASPSVWYPGWSDYADKHDIHTRSVYISLGKKEKNNRYKVFSTVADNCLSLYEKYRHSDLVSCCTFEWNEGNHSADPDMRVAKGFAWLLNQP